jgi:hypothetical protein
VGTIKAEVVMADGARGKRKGAALRQIAGSVDKQAEEMPPLKKKEDGEGLNRIADQLRKRATNAEND